MPDYSPETETVSPFPVPETLATLVDLLEFRATHEPTRVVYRFLEHGEGLTDQLNYRQLSDQARAIANWFMAREGGGQGRRAVLLYQAGLECLAAYFGCLYAGLQPVFLLPPSSSNDQAALETLHRVVGDCGADFVLADEPSLVFRSAFEQTFDTPKLEWLSIGDIEPRAPDATNWRKPDLNGDTIVHLQYTSGSTSVPKGIVVTHANLLENLKAVGSHCGYTPASVLVSWLPHYHDMGLLNGFILPLYSNFCCYLMSPGAFIQRPLRWLEAMSHYRATHIVAPNFAYELCSRKVGPAQVETLDLSRVGQAYIAAEPVRWETMQNFARVFAPAGFRFEMFAPGYGLAEATLGVSARTLDSSPRYLSLAQSELRFNRVRLAHEGEEAEDSLKIVSCGKTLPGVRVVVADLNEGTECPPDRIGEVWVQSPSVTPGYLNQADLTRQIFGARLADGEGPFLRTGDLGFVWENELYIAGRIKDVIIIRGQNHWPQDLELTVEQARPDLFRAGCSAAFSVDVNGEERLVVVAEVNPVEGRLDQAELTQSVRQEIARQHQLSLYKLVLLKKNALLKTTSGKVQRSMARQAWLDNTLAQYDGS